MEEVLRLQNHFKQNCRQKEYGAHSAKVHSVAWNCDGKKLASGSFDQTANVFYLDKDRLSREQSYKGHTDSVDQLCWHPNHPDLFATASGDKTVRTWDSRSGKCITTMQTKGENINICWSPNGQTIAVGNKEDLVTFFDTKTWKPKAHEQFKVEVNEISWNNSNDLFFLTTGLGTVNILSFPDLKLIQSLTGHTANCICIEFDPSGRYFATGSADALVNLWDVTELVCVRTFSRSVILILYNMSRKYNYYRKINRLDWPVRTLSFNHNGTLLASASEDHFIDISSVHTGKNVCEVKCESPTFTVAWHPKQNMLAFACDDKDKYKHDRDAGSVKLFGLPNESSTTVEKK